MLALLQFDSAALPLITQMLADGRLPALADLRRRGTWMGLDAHTLLQSAAHPTLYTGMDVRDHGLYSAFPWSSADQRAYPVQRFAKPPTIWERLTQRGRRSLVVDPYLSWAPREMAGAYLSGCHFVDRIVLPRRSVPAHVRRDLVRRHGRPPRLDDVYGRPRIASLTSLRDHLVRSPDRVAGAVVDLLRNDTFDLLWLTFGAAHKAGHHLWDAASIADGAILPDDSRALRDGLESVYVAIDRAIARVIDALPQDADVIAFSPTGMGPNRSRADLLPGMLDAVLTGASGGPAPARRGSRSPIWSLRARVPVKWRSWIASALPDDVAANLTTRLYLQADWPRTRAMAVPGENQGYVRLNLRGREREGCVDPAAADALLAARGALADAAAAQLAAGAAGWPALGGALDAAHALLAALGVSTARLDALVALARDIRARYPAIALTRVLRHSDVDHSTFPAETFGAGCAAFRRKEDPGSAFPWDAFKAALAR